MLKGFLEVAVFLERFRNIDLSQQGLYHLRLSVSREGVFACPYDCVKTSKADPLITLIPASGDALDTHISTSTFLVRYSEEEVQLRELWLFRFEGLPSEMDHLMLTAELCYSELDRNFSDLAHLPDRLDSMESIKFKSVTETKIRLKNPKAGIFEPLIIEFDERYKALVLGCVFSVMFDYKWRQDGGKQTSPNNFSRSMSETLLTDFTGMPKLLVGADETDQLYHDFVHPQALSHELLRSYLADIVKRYLPPENRGKFSDLPQPLSLPYVQNVQGQKTDSFSKALDTHNPERVCEALLSEISHVAVEIHQLIQRLRDLITAFPLHCMSPLFEKRLERLKNWSGCSVKKAYHCLSAVPFLIDIDFQPLRKHQSSDVRRMISSFQGLYDSPVEEQLGRPAESPVLFEDAYYREEQTESTESSPVGKRAHRRKHLFVLVHGLHGTASDMRLVKHSITSYSTIATVLCATANEESTERDIYDMGERLAREIKTYIHEWLPGGTLARMSFVGYSLGGLIIRAAFPHLTEYASLMHTFITFSTPHLGHSLDVSIVGAGLWVMERFNRSQLLQQLMLTDSQDPKRMALYRLSQSPGLEWFKHIMFCSSFQDKYVPHDSARVEVTMIPPNSGPSLHIDMAKNLVRSLIPERFRRLDVDFSQNGLSLDSVTGRKAHLQFISSEHFLKILIYQYPELFT